MATLRNPANISPVVDGEVFFSLAEDPKVSAKGEFGSEWYTAGILTDGSRVGLNRVIDKNKTQGWGFGVVAVDTRPGELTGTVETLEDNYITRYIAWPTSSPGVAKKIEGATIKYHDEVVARVHVGMVERMQNGNVRIRVTRQKAVATMEDIGFGQEVTGREISLDFFSGENKDAFEELIITGEAAVRSLNDELIRIVEQLPDKKANVKVTLPANVSGGTWSLTVDGKAPITGLAHNVSASDLKSSIEGLGGITDVTVTGNATNGYMIKLTGASSVTADGSALTGGDSTEIKVDPQ